MDKGGHERVAARLGTAFYEILLATKQQRVTPGQRDEWSSACDAAAAAGLPPEMWAKAIGDARVEARHAGE